MHTIVQIVIKKIQIKLPYLAFLCTYRNVIENQNKTISILVYNMIICDQFIERNYQISFLIQYINLYCLALL